MDRVTIAIIIELFWIFIIYLLFIIELLNYLLQVVSFEWPEKGNAVNAVAKRLLDIVQSAGK